MLSSRSRIVTQRFCRTSVSFVVFFKAAGEVKCDILLLTLAYLTRSVELVMLPIVILLLP